MEVGQFCMEVGHFYPARPKGWGRVYISRFLSVCVSVCLCVVFNPKGEGEGEGGYLLSPVPALQQLTSGVGDYLGTTWGLLGDYLGTTWGLLGDYLGTTWGLLGDYLGTTWGLLGDYFGDTLMILW
jgi:hypothetical protein